MRFAKAVQAVNAVPVWPRCGYEDHAQKRDDVGDVE
jgi:hypothetical protein